MNIAFATLFESCAERIVDRAQRLRRAEDGQLSILSLVMVLAMLVILCVVMNAITVIRHKMEAQNSADAVAYGATTQMARGMNSVTATNHLIGELQALVVLHHGLGGDALNTGSRRNRVPANTKGIAGEAYFVAKEWTNYMKKRFQPKRRIHRQFNKPVRTQGALRRAKVELKRVATHAYCVHSVAGFLNRVAWIVKYASVVVPPLRGVAQTARAWARWLARAARDYETQVGREYRLLDSIEGIARAAVPSRKMIQLVAIPALHRHSQMQVEAAADRLEATADSLGAAHQCRGSLFPGLHQNPSRPILRLPVLPEPSVMTERQLQESQLVRASTPWVQCWRLPLLQFADQSLVMSHFKDFYVQQTQQATWELAREAKSRGVNLYVIDGFDSRRMQKGDEPWSDSRIEADRRFCIIGFSHRSAPQIAYAAEFSRPNDDGIAAFAQGMIYNGNQQRGKLSSDFQAQVGWDTLNWLNADVPEWRLGNDPAKRTNTSYSYYERRAREPRIRLNWRNTLVPTTRLEEAQRWQRGSLGRIMRRTTVDTGIARTH